MTRTRRLFVAIALAITLAPVLAQEKDEKKWDVTADLGPTSKLTSLSAHNVSGSSVEKSSLYLRIRLKGVFTASMTVSRKLVCLGLTIPMR